jgi:hypothetical protein
MRDTAYLRWKVQYMRSNGVFILYRSSDGINFNVIGTKNVFGISINKPIAYYFRDADYGGGTKYYRLVYISSASEYLVSEKIKVGAENIVGVAQK